MKIVFVVVQRPPVFFLFFTQSKHSSKSDFASFFFPSHITSCSKEKENTTITTTTAAAVVAEPNKIVCSFSILTVNRRSLCMWRTLVCGFFFLFSTINRVNRVLWIAWNVVVVVVLLDNGSPSFLSSKNLTSLFLFFSRPIIVNDVFLFVQWLRRRSFTIITNLVFICSQLNRVSILFVSINVY